MLRRAIRTTALLCLVAGVPAAAHASGQATSPLQVYRGVTVISPEQPGARAAMTIVVDGERIRAVVPDGAPDAALPRGARVHDASGLYALPGLIDSHVHYATRPDRPYAQAQMRRALYAGVTAVRDMAGDARLLDELARASASGAIPGPDVYFAALVAGPSFFLDPRARSAAEGESAGSVDWLQAVGDDTDLAAAVGRARTTHATGLKIYANLSGAIVRGLIDQAHRQHFPVWTHLQVYPATPYDSLGATSVSHACMIARYVLEPAKAAYGHADEPSYEHIAADDPGITRYIAALAASGTILDATLSVYPAAQSLPHGCTRALAGAIAGASHRAGVPVAAGTDVSAAPDDPFPSLHGELAALVRDAGLSPFDAIVAATLTGARVLGHEDDFGTLEAGKLANIVFVRANPLDDIGNLRRVALTLKRGVRYPRRDYRPQAVRETAD